MKRRTIHRGAVSTRIGLGVGVDVGYRFAYGLRARKPKGYSFTLTACAYNFSWWFNGEVLLIPLADAFVLARDVGEEVEARVYLAENAEPEAVDRAVEHLVHSIGLNEDLSGFYSIASRDPLLSRSLEVLYGMHVRTSTPWIASVTAVCQQNAGFKQGWKALYRFLELFGRRAVINGIETLVPPAPADVGEDKAGLLMRTGMGYRVKTVLRLAGLFKDSPHLNSWEADPRELEQALLEVKGVGGYTSRLTLVLSLRAYDRPPVDRWLRRIASEVYGINENSVEEFYTSFWSGWGGLAAFYTTVALDAEPLTRALDRVRRGLVKPSLDRLSPLTMWRYL